MRETNKAGAGQSFFNTGRGNSVGNISNSGYIVMQGEWIYFNSFAEERGLSKRV